MYDTFETINSNVSRSCEERISQGATQKSETECNEDINNIELLTTTSNSMVNGQIDTTFWDDLDSHLDFEDFSNE